MSKTGDTDTAENRKETLAARATEDPDRQPFEKETGILFSKDRDRADVTVAEGALIRRFLLHPDFELKHYQTNDDGDVIQVDGTIGIEYLTVSTNPRGNTQHANMVSGQVLR